MGRVKIAPANDWKTRVIKDWNAVTFQTYMVDQLDITFTNQQE